jgi:hypothetical protein
LSFILYHCFDRLTLDPILDCIALLSIYKQ